jgi:translation initiation factor 4G
MLKLEHPNKLLHSIFDKLYDEEVVSESGFFAWEANDDPAEQEGKGVALKSCTQFFTWLKEAEEEEEDTYCDPDRTVNPNAY